METLKGLPKNIRALMDKCKKSNEKNPISINGDTLAASALSLMNSKKITSLCVQR